MYNIRLIFVIGKNINDLHSQSHVKRQGNKSLKLTTNAYNILLNNAISIYRN